MKGRFGLPQVVVTALGLAAVFAACSASVGPAEEAAVAPSVEVRVVTPAVEASATVVPPPAQQAATAAPTPTVVPTSTGQPALPFLNLPLMTQLTPLAGGGDRPLFRWESFDEATGYMLYVYTPEGEPYWSWIGPDTETFLGGSIAINADKPGPRIIDGMSWTVIAIDDDLTYLAVSEQRWISP